MDGNQRLKLQEMITENNVQDNTNLIRMFQHSQRIRDDITKLAELRRDYGRLDKQRFDELCKSRCSFLYNSYTDLFNRIVRNEIDMDVMDKVLASLKKIEDSEMDQHEASFEVGTLLKKMYVDSAMRRQKTREDEDRRRDKEKARDRLKKLNAKRGGKGKGKDDGRAHNGPERSSCTWSEYKKSFL
jgi:hypothetical protein